MTFDRIPQKDDSGHCSECMGEIDAGLCICDPCELRICEHKAHCDGCGRGMLEYSPTGFCFVCDFEWMAQRQLTFPGNGRLSGRKEIGLPNEFPSRPTIAETLQSEGNVSPAQIIPGSFSGWLKQPTKEIGASLQETSTKEIAGITAAIRELNRHFGINE